MPFIPLPKLNTDLPMPEVPALDHLDRPRLDARGMIGAVEDFAAAARMPEMDSEPFVDAAGAMEHAVGRALSRAGNVFEALAVKRQGATDDRIIQEAHAAMRRENDRLQKYRQDTPDTSRWLPEARRGMAAVLKPFQNVAGASPATQEQLGVMANAWQKTTDIHTQTAVAKDEFARAANAYWDNIVAARWTGDYDEADRLTREGGGRGYFSEEDVSGLLADTAASKRDDSLWSVIHEHPREAPEWFKDGDKLAGYKLTAWERREWLHRAQASWEDQERRAVAAIVEGMAGGVIETPKDLEPWKVHIGDRAHAELSSMLAEPARPRSMNDDASMEQAIAAIENVKTGADVKSLLSQARLGHWLASEFSGSKLNELRDRLAKRVSQPEGTPPNVLGPALQRLNQWAFGIMEMSGAHTLPIDEGHGYPMERIVESVKSIRESLERDLKNSSIRTDEEAIDFVTKKVVGAGWSPLRLAAVPGPVTQQAVKGGPDQEPTATLVKSGPPHIVMAFSDGTRRVVEARGLNEQEVEQRAQGIRETFRTSPGDEAKVNELIRERQLKLLRRHLPGATIADIPEVAPSPRLLSVTVSGGVDHLGEIPVDFQWSPYLEKMKDTVRLGDYREDRGGLGTGDRAKWREKFKSTYGTMAVNSAWANKVPARLLAILAANEMAAPDWGRVAAFADNMASGKSLGPLQITAATVRKEGAARSEAETWHMLLNQPGHNFDIGGRLLRTYLSRLATDVAEGKHKQYSQSFGVLSTLSSPNSSIYKDLQTIRSGNAEEIFTLRPSDGLVRALAAIWNNGFGVVHTENIAISAENADAHANAAASLYGHIDELMPKVQSGTHKVKIQTIEKP